MKTFTRCVVASITLLLAVLTCPTALKAAAPLNPTVAANNAFGFDLYGQLKDTPGNLFFSPITSRPAWRLRMRVRGEIPSSRYPACSISNGAKLT
jgi:hypothetical protein